MISFDQIDNPIWPGLEDINDNQLTLNKKKRSSYKANITGTRTNTKNKATRNNKNGKGKKVERDSSTPSIKEYLERFRRVT